MLSAGRSGNRGGRVTIVRGLDGVAVSSISALDAEFQARNG
jgi:hypothetical protein